MADLQQLHTQAKKLILTIRAGLERLETAEQVSQAAAVGGWAAGAAGCGQAWLPNIRGARVLLSTPPLLRFSCRMQEP